MKRSELKRTSGLSARGKGGACPPRPGTKDLPKYNGIRWQKLGLAICPDCERCGDYAIDVHHVIYRAALRRLLSPEVYAVACMDQRNAMCLCRRCHDEHHARVRPILRGELPPSVQGFAVEHGLVWLLEKVYPLKEEEAA